MFLTIARRPNRAAPMLRAHDTAIAALAHVTPTTITCTAHWNQEV